MNATVSTAPVSGMASGSPNSIATPEIPGPMTLPVAQRNMKLVVTPISAPPLNRLTNHVD